MRALQRSSDWQGGPGDRKMRHPRRTRAAGISLFSVDIHCAKVPSALVLCGCSLC